MIILLLIIALIFNVLAQFFLKHAIQVNQFTGVSFETLSKIIMTPFVWFGAALYAGSFLFYFLALTKGELSRISPVSQALTTLGVVMISVLFFHEQLTLFKVIGLTFLVMGTLIIFF